MDDEPDNYKFPSGGDSIDEEPDETDIARFERDDFIQCPHCKKYNHPEALRCRFCKLFLTDDFHRPEGKPLWMRVTIIVMLILMVMSAIFGFATSGLHFDVGHWGK